MAPLLARMKAEETRKAALLEELATLDGAAGLGDPRSLGRNVSSVRKRPTCGAPSSAGPTKRRPSSARSSKRSRSRPWGRGALAAIGLRPRDRTGRCWAKLPHRVVAPTGFEPVSQLERVVSWLAVTRTYGVVATGGCHLASEFA
jgi:hypothetical protein